MHTLIFACLLQDYSDIFPSLPPCGNGAVAVAATAPKIVGFECFRSSSSRCRTWIYRDYLLLSFVADVENPIAFAKLCTKAGGSKPKKTKKNVLWSMDWEWGCSTPLPFFMRILAEGGEPDIARRSVISSSCWKNFTLERRQKEEM